MVKPVKLLCVLRPDLKNFWDFGKNPDGLWDIIGFQSDKKVWWLCEFGHSISVRVSDKVAKNIGCGVCSYRVLLTGFNDLSSVFPEVAAQWHPTRNYGLVPSCVLARSGRKVWWLGACGHEWDSRVSDRVTGSGCPFCAGQRVLVGFNDLGTQHPDVAAEFHLTKNNSLSSGDVTGRSGRKVWWVCGLNHEWEATVYNRVILGHGCPFCANRKVLKGFNDLDSVYPEVAAQWHPTRNGGLMPDHVIAGSSKKIWWQCKKGHEWETSVAGRVDVKTGKARDCPYCSGKNVLSGFNDLVTTHPVVASQWHPTKNGGLTPEDVSYGSKRKVWWVGKCGHEWEASVVSRVNGQGCGFCFGAGVNENNNLFAVNPRLAEEFDENKNFPLTSSDVRAGFTGNVWWVCDNGHQWENSVYNRNVLGQGCSKCGFVHTSRIEGLLGEELALAGFGELQQGVAVPDLNWGSGRAMVVDFVGVVDGVSIVVEYDGSRWHSGVLDKVPGSTMKRDIDKSIILLEAGFKVVRVREQAGNVILPGLPIMNSNFLSINYVYDAYGKGLSNVAVAIFNWVKSF